MEVVLRVFETAAMMTGIAFWMVVIAIVINVRLGRATWEVTWNRPSGLSQAASPAACTCDMYLNRTLVHLTSCPLAPKTSNPTEGG